MSRIRKEITQRGALQEARSLRAERRLREDERLRRLIAQRPGISLAALADYLRCSPTTVANNLKRLGIGRRPAPASYLSDVSLTTEDEEVMRDAVRRAEGKVR